MTKKKDNWFDVDEEVFAFIDLPAVAGLEGGEVPVPVFDLSQPDPLDFAPGTEVPGVDSPRGPFADHGLDWPPVGSAAPDLLT